MDEATTPNGSNGYARIREVYTLFREQDERFDKRLREMEDRIQTAIAELRTEQQGHWQQHDTDSQSIRDRLHDIDQQEMLTAQYMAGKSATFKSVSNFSNWVEGHWRTLSFLTFVVLVVLDWVFHIRLFNFGGN